ncbi:hypothetical protein BpHYR1_033022 [Brachionus plicatilis]|uniref:Uncharacterized protein n=1 Tax=Brachionus plicatilis TaxID=10195 RepID=A0A3M7QSX8_BRAPC|nr:hypothetical protein BpHYR1_033022 [Brachionus plicatilis]
MFNDRLFFCNHCAAVVQSSCYLDLGLKCFDDVAANSEETVEIANNGLVEQINNIEDISSSNRDDAVEVVSANNENIEPTKKIIK